MRTRDAAGLLVRRESRPGVTRGHGEWLRAPCDHCPAEGKATDTRAARWLLALVAASTVGLMLAPLLAPSRIDQTYTSYLRFAAVGLSILLPIVSILTLTSEWSQRTVLTTFTQEPRRIRVINAKVTVSLLLAGGAAVFGGLVTAAGLGVAAASGRELDANLNLSFSRAAVTQILDRTADVNSTTPLAGHFWAYTILRLI